MRILQLVLAVAATLAFAPVAFAQSAPPPITDCCRVPQIPDIPKAVEAAPAPVEACYYRDQYRSCDGGYAVYCPGNNRCYRDRTDANRACPGSYYIAECAR